jgi:hypothetical protein
MVGIVLFGLIGYAALPVSDLPTVDYPTINVNASLPARTLRPWPRRSRRRWNGNSQALPASIRSTRRTRKARRRSLCNSI